MPFPHEEWWDLIGFPSTSPITKTTFEMDLNVLETPVYHNGNGGDNGNGDDDDNDDNNDYESNIDMIWYTMMIW